MEIEKVYERLVKDLTAACKSLGWTFETEQDTDGFLFLIIDQCRYFVSPTVDFPPSADPTEQKTLYYLGVMVQHPGNREEPPSEDDRTISNCNFEDPRTHLSDLLNAHWRQRKDWAMEATITPEDMGAEEGLT